MLVCVLVNFSWQNADYMHSEDCGWIFAQHFCNRLGAAYLALKNLLDESNPSHAEVLNDIKRRFREETFTRESIAQVIHAHSDLVSLLFGCIYARNGTHFLGVDQLALRELCDGSLSGCRPGFPVDVCLYERSFTNMH